MTHAIPASGGNVTPRCLSDLVHGGAMVGEVRTGARRFWTGREATILRRFYPTLGLAGCLEHLPGRSAGAVYQYAARLGLVVPIDRKATRPSKADRWPASPAIDEILRREYPRRTHRGAVTEIAQLVGRPRWWVSKRAVRLGLVEARRKEPRWTEQECELVAQAAALPPQSIARKLRRHGFRRTPTAISIQLKRLHQPTGRNADIDHYSACGLATLMGIDSHQVGRWIARGWLAAERRGTARLAVQGGDEWRISRHAVRSFLLEHTQTVDHRKIDKTWLFDLLAHPGKAPS